MRFFFHRDRRQSMNLHGISGFSIEPEMKQVHGELRETLRRRHISFGFAWGDPYPRIWFHANRVQHEPEPSKLAFVFYWCPTQGVSVRNYIKEKSLGILK